MSESQSLAHIGSAVSTQRPKSSSATEPTKTYASPPTEFESASVLQRFAARAVDSAVAIAIAEVPSSVAPSRSFLEAFLLILFAGLGLGYYVLGDGIFAGAALGKRMFGICVVDEASREPCSIAQAAIRMGILVIPFAAAIEPVALACDSQQRWGDRIARTYVLRRHPKALPWTSMPSRPLNLAGLGDTLRKIRHPAEDA